MSFSNYSELSRNAHVKVKVIVIAFAAKLASFFLPALKMHYVTQMNDIKGASLRDETKVRYIIANFKTRARCITLNVYNGSQHKEYADECQNVQHFCAS